MEERWAWNTKNHIHGHFGEGSCDHDTKVAMLLCGLGNRQSKLKIVEHSVLYCGGPLKTLGDQGGRERALAMSEMEFLGSVSGQELEENLTRATTVSYCFML